MHTVVPGRPIGLHPGTVAELALAGVHLHFYGDFTSGQWREWIDKASALAPKHLHSCRAQRMQFGFDTHVPALVDFFPRRDRRRGKGTAGGGVKWLAGRGDARA